MKVCFLLTHVPNPRMNKRINVYKKHGPVSVVCTRRKSQNIWEPQVDGVDYNIYDIDLPAATHIVRRFVMSREYQKVALKKLETINPDVLYCASLDSLIIASKYKKAHEIKIIYEVADLRESYIASPRNIVKKMQNHSIKSVEKRLFKNVDRLVVTSPQFYKSYYYKLIEKNKMIFIPNSPDADVFKRYLHKTSGKFTIGFIGAIRYLKQMKMLVDVAGELGCNVVFAGAGGTNNDYEEIVKYCEGKKNVIFTGRYNYEEEIVKLYGMVDCVYAVYDTSNPNVRIALPNKLYESVICELPIIVAKNTYLSELVQEWGVGVSVSDTDKRELTQVISTMMEDKDYYDSLVANCKAKKVELSSGDLEEKLKV